MMIPRRPTTPIMPYPSRVSLAVSLVLLLGSSALGGCAKAPTLGSTLQDAGFTRLLAPRDAIQPGTILTLQEQTDGRAVNVVCWASQAYPTLPPPSASATADVTRLSARGDRFTLEPEYANLVKAKAGLEQDSKVVLSIENAVVAEAALADLVAAEESREQKCARVIDRVLGSGAPLYVVTKVLTGDLVYTIEGSRWSGLDAEARAAKLAALEVALDATRESSSADTLRGKDLSIGMFVEQLGPGKNLQFHQEDEEKPTGNIVSLSVSGRKKAVARPTFLLVTTSEADR